MEFFIPPRSHHATSHVVIPKERVHLSFVMTTSNAFLRCLDVDVGQIYGVESCIDSAVILQNVMNQYLGPSCKGGLLVLYMFLYEFLLLVKTSEISATAQSPPVNRCVTQYL